MKKMLLLLSCPLLLLNACRHQSDGSDAKEIANAVYGKTFSGTAGDAPCSVTVHWSESRVEEVSMTGPRLERFTSANAAADRLNYFLNLKSIATAMQSSEFGREQLAKGYTPWRVVERNPHVIFEGLTLSGAVGWSMGESIQFPAPSTRNVVEQELTMYGKIDFAQALVELTSVELRQSAFKGAPMAEGSAKVTCKSLVAN